MTSYTKMTLKEFIDLARNSSPELGSLGYGWLINYETGERGLIGDEETAIFLASAREIVLELVRRLQETGREQVTTCATCGGNLLEMPCHHCEMQRMADEEVQSWEGHVEIILTQDPVYPGLESILGCAKCGQLLRDCECDDE